MKRKVPLQPMLDRRELLSLGGAAALALVTPEAAANARRAETMLALADPRYSDSLVFARGLEREGASVLLLAPNMGTVWFDDIEPRLQAGPRQNAGLRQEAGLRLAGLTLESDLFVLERLAEPTGARTRFVGLHDWRCRPGAIHSLCGSIGLGGIEAALVGSEDRWAEKLASALTAGAEQSQERQRRSVRLDEAWPAADSPKFFVSWLMTWMS